MVTEDADATICIWWTSLPCLQSEATFLYPILQTGHPTTSARIKSSGTTTTGWVSDDNDSMGIGVIQQCCDTSGSVPSGSVGAIAFGITEVEATAGSRLVEDIPTIGTDVGWGNGQVDVYIFGWGWVDVSNQGDNANPLERMLMTCTTGIPSNATSNCCTTSACNKSAICLMCDANQIFVLPEDGNDRVKNTMDEIKSHLYKGLIIDCETINTSVTKETALLSPILRSSPSSRKSFM